MAETLISKIEIYNAHYIQKAFFAVHSKPFALVVFIISVFFYKHTFLSFFSSDSVLRDRITTWRERKKERERQRKF